MGRRPRCFFVCLVKIYDWIFVKHYNLSRENRELKDQLEKMEAGAGELRQELADLREVVFHQQSGAEEEKAEVNLRKILRRLTSVFYTANVWQDLKWQCGGDNIKCCSVPSGKNEETGERTYSGIKTLRG